MGTYVVSLTYVDTGLVSHTLNMAIGAGIATTDNGYIQGGAASWASPTQKADFSSTGIVTGDADQGKIKVYNFADSLSASGVFDTLIRTASFQGQTATLYYLHNNVWAERLQIDFGITEQPVVNIAEGQDVQDDLTFPLRDPRAGLTKPLQPTRYLGNNPGGGSGVEGTTADLAGKPKPVSVGAVGNVSIPCVSRPLLIYQLADTQVAINLVRDGGVVLSYTGVLWTTVAAMLAAASPAAGFYSTCQDPAMGTYIRLGSSPVKGIAADFTQIGGSTYVGGCWLTLSNRFGRTTNGTINTQLIPAGFWWGPDDDVTQRQALDELLKSASAVEVLRTNPLGWVMQTLGNTTGIVGASGTKATLQILQPGTRMTANDRKLLSVATIRPPWCKDGAAPYIVTANYGRNYTVMTPSDFNGAAAPALVDTFSKEFRSLSVFNSTIWSDALGTGMFPNSYEMKIDISISYDFSLASTYASTEITRVQGLVSAFAGCFQVSYVPLFIYDAVTPTVDTLFVGDAIKLVLPRYGNPSAQNYLVLQAGLQVDKNGPVITAIIGMEAP